MNVSFNPTFLLMNLFHRFIDLYIYIYIYEMTYIKGYSLYYSCIRKRLEAT